MKKFLTSLVLVSVLTVLAAPALTLAQQGTADSCTISPGNLTRINASTDLNCASPCNFSTANCGMCCVLNTVYKITDWFFFFLLAIAVIFIIWGGFLFVFSGGDPEKTGTARRYLIYAAVGIAVALLARAIPAMVKAIVGMS